MIQRLWIRCSETLGYKYTNCQQNSMFLSKHDICITKFQREKSCWKFIGSSWESICGPSGSEIDMVTTWRNCLFWYSFYLSEEWTWVTYISNVLSIKTILFDILEFWCQLVVIRFVKTLSKRRMFVSFMKISACWLLHRLIKFNKICWEKRPAKTRPNLRTSFYKRDLKNTQPHLKPGGRLQDRRLAAQVL